jgi:hypothetical protein
LGICSPNTSLALLYWDGHGVPKDANKAYFWAVLASAGGQEGSKDLAKVLADGMTRTQVAAIDNKLRFGTNIAQAQAKRSPLRLKRLSIIERVHLR